MKLRLGLAVMCMLAGAGVYANGEDASQESFWRRFSALNMNMLVSEKNDEKCFGVCALGGQLGAVYIAYRVASWMLGSKKNQHKKH